LREALRLRARWLHELTARIAMELGRRLTARGLLDDPAAVTGLRLDELAGAVTGTWTPAGQRLAGRPASPGADVPLPAAFQLSADGEVVPARLGGSRRESADPGSVTGVPAGGGIGAGTVHHGENPGTGAVLVVDTLSPQLAASLPGLAGLVSTTGSPLSHLAILARELGVPTVVGVADARQALPAGAHVVVDGNSGRVDIVPDSPRSLGAGLPEAVRERPVAGPRSQDGSTSERSTP
ncbi:pyruvate, phosphate dikinase, partial [Frankia sp. CNm7]